MTSQPENPSNADEQLADILEQFLDGHEDHQPLTEQFLATHPEHALDLKACLQTLEYLRGHTGTGVKRSTSTAARTEPATRALRDYEILREIGRGGMGVVFEAVQRSLDRRVALKVLPWATLLDGRQRERFRNEARLAAQLHHTNIVPIYSVGSEHGIDFYAMQYIDGEPLTAWSGRHGTQEPDTIQAVVSLGIQAADALAHAHQMGVIHRDIKPSNLLVDRTGNLWITDFGVARSQSPLGLTATGDRVGTVNYMSPEQFRGEPIDHRTDIYALGVTLLELLAPERNSWSPTGLVEAAVTEPRHVGVRSSDKRRLPRDLETILRKCTTPAREGRYPYANEMADDLRRFLRGEPIAAQRPGLLTLGAKWVMRHRRLAAAWLLATFLTLAGLAVTTAIVWSQRLETERHRDRAEHLLAVRQAHQAVQHLENGDSAGLLELVEARRTAEQDPALARDIESLWSRWHATLEGRLFQVFGHDKAVVQLAFNPDGDLLATASDDATVVLWDAHNGQRRAVLGHGHPVTAMCFHEDGRLLATGDASGSVRVWNVADGQQVGSDREHSGGAVRALAFRPGARMLAVATANSNITRLWTIDHDAEPVDLKHQGTVRRIQFINRGRGLTATAGKALYFWDVDSGQLRLAPIQHKHTMDVLCASPDGSLVATGGPDGIAGVWHVDNGHEVSPAPRHPKMLLDMQFSPDGRWLATAHADRTVRRWDTSTWQEHGEPLRHGKQIGSLAFSPDSRVLVSASWDGGVRTWDIESGTLEGPAFWHQGAVRSIAFDHSGMRLATASDDSTARLWNLDGVGRGVLLRQTASVRALAVTADSRRLVTGTSSGEVTCWELANREVRWQAKSHGQRVNSVAISNDGALVASASEDCTVRLWNSVNGEPHGEPLRFFEGVKALAFQPGVNALIIGCNDRTVTLWDLEAGQRRQLCRDDEAVKALAVDQRGGMLAYGTNGLQTHVRSLNATSELIASLPHGDRVRSLCFSPASAGFLAVGGEDGVVRLWSVPGFSPRGLPLEQGGEVYDLDIDSTGSLLATAIRDRTFVRLWDLATTLACDGVPLVRSDRALSARFTPDGKWLVSGWVDGACWLWPLPVMPESVAAMERETFLALGARLDRDNRPAAISWREYSGLRATLSH